MIQGKKYLKAQSQKHKETENYTGNLKIWKRDLNRNACGLFWSSGGKDRNRQRTRNEIK